MVARTISVLALAMTLGVALATPARATVSIVAVDPGTGQVGVAGASCVQFDLARIASVLPGVGVAVSQGRERVRDPILLLNRLRRTGDPSWILARAPRSGPAAARQERQYGVVTLNRGALTRTGNAVAPVAAEISAKTVVVVGNDLPDRRVVDRAEAAFLHSSGTLADRLIAGLEASSAAGGDRRCHSQTATAAFIIVASRGESPIVPIRGLPAALHRRKEVLAMVGKTVAADELGDLLRDAAGLKHPSGPTSPMLYLSLIQPRHGFNAVSLLAQGYAQVLATPTATPTPATASPTVAAGFVPPSGSGSGAGRVVLYGGLAMVAVAVLWGLRRRSRRPRAAGEIENPTTKT